MDPLNSAALNGLRAALDQMLGDLTPAITLFAARFVPVGLGSLIGSSHLPGPEAELFGRRLQAEAVITAAADALADVQAEASAILLALTGATRSVTRGLGLLKLELIRRDPPRPSTDQVDGPQVLELHFNLLFEYIHVPQTAGDRIDTLEVTSSHNGTDEAFQISKP